MGFLPLVPHEDAKSVGIHDHVALVAEKDVAYVVIAPEGRPAFVRA